MRDRVATHARDIAVLLPVVEHSVERAPEFSLFNEFSRNTLAIGATIHDDYMNVAHGAGAPTTAVKHRRAWVRMANACCMSVRANDPRWFDAYSRSLGSADQALLSSTLIGPLPEGFRRNAHGHNTRAAAPSDASFRPTPSSTSASTFAVLDTYKSLQPKSRTRVGRNVVATLTVAGLLAVASLAWWILSPLRVDATYWTVSGANTSEPVSFDLRCGTRLQPEPSDDAVAAAIVVGIDESYLTDSRPLWPTRQGAMFQTPGPLSTEAYLSEAVQQCTQAATNPPIAIILLGVLSAYLAAGLIAFNWSVGRQYRRGPNKF